MQQDDSKISIKGEAERDVDAIEKSGSRHFTNACNIYLLRCVCCRVNDRFSLNAAIKKPGFDAWVFYQWTDPI